MKSIRVVAVKAAIQPRASLLLQDHEAAEVQEAQVGTMPFYHAGQCKEICFWAGKQMRWLQNLTLVIHVGLSPHFILSELQNRFLSPVKFGQGGGVCLRSELAGHRTHFSSTGSSTHSPRCDLS